MAVGIKAHDFEEKKPEVKITTSLQQQPRLRPCVALSLHLLHTLVSLFKILHLLLSFTVVVVVHVLGGVPVPTAWRVLGLWMEEQPPAMEVSWEYIA
jgi:hypothetical protein